MGSYLEFCHTRLTTEVPQEVIAFWNSGEIERDRLSRVLVNDDQTSVVSEALDKRVCRIDISAS